MNENSLKNYKVSAIVSTYNSEKFIKGCLIDLTDQTLFKKGELEIIVINSGSQQNEDAVVKEFRKKFQNIKYIQTQEREGIYAAWNRGIKTASGEYITNSNTDDRYKSDALEIMAATLDEKKDIDLVYADIFITGEPNETFDTSAKIKNVVRPDFSANIMLTGCHMGPQPMWRKSIHDKVGYFNDAYTSAGDYEFWCRMVFRNNSRLFHIQKFLGLYLYNQNGIELSNVSKSVQETETIKNVYKLYSNKRNVFLHNPEEAVDIIFLTYNRLSYFFNTIACLIERTRHPYRIIIVDNNSSADFKISLKQTEILYDEIIYNADNEWTAAFQKGIEVSKSDPFVVSDPDILVPNFEGKCWLERLVDLHKQNPEMGLIALNLDRSNLPAKLPDVYLGEKEIYNNEITLSNVGTVMQAIKRKYFNFKYITDWETCERIRRNGGKVGFAKNIVGYHLGWNEEDDYPDYMVEKYKFFKTVYGVDTYKMNTEKKEILDRMDNAIHDSAKPEVSIIVPIFNQVDYTKIMLSSVLENSPPNIEIILVDNNSTEKADDFIELIKNNGFSIKLIRNKENLGFPKAVNQGIEISQGKYVVIANNDIIVNKNWLNRFIDTAKSNENIGIVSGISNSVSGVQIDKNAKYETIEEMKIYAGKVAVENQNKIWEFPRVAFLCTLIKREVIEKIGGLDERFSPGNYEDDDYCLRAQIAGYKTVIAKDVFIHHFGSKSFKADGNEKYEKLLNRNRNIFVDKWGSDPDEIWLQGKTVKSRTIEFPVFGNKIEKHFRRGFIHIQENEYAEAKEELKKCAAEFEKSGMTVEGNISLKKIKELLGKIEAVINKNYENRKNLQGTASTINV